MIAELQTYAEMSASYEALALAVQQDTCSLVLQDPIVTEVAPVSKYAGAEVHHQEYLARGGRFGKAQNPAKGCSDPIRCYG